ncbi:MAG: flotillin-like FloA family protein, partial [Desulfobacterales bacterium]|nr:flotillin-like FloA family protein [Desulfobacterales bacterium]
MFTNIILVIIGIAILGLFYFVSSAISLWLQAIVSGARVGLIAIVFMRFRKVPPKLIVNVKIMAAKAGLNISTNDLESHFLAGGDVMRVAQAL